MYETSQHTRKETQPGNRFGDQNEKRNMLRQDLSCTNLCVRAIGALGQRAVGEQWDSAGISDSLADSSDETTSVKS